MKDNPLADDTKALRLDKWLWYARFFKTRNIATRLIASGKLRLNGEVMTKPHRATVVGQVLTFVQQNDIRVIEIAALAQRRGPATEAAELYNDLSPPVIRTSTDDRAEQGFENRTRGSGRPTKRLRRETDQLKAIHLADED
ncbi:MAG: RNA-binding S4 domain-containing protein [Candidatus Puniceispirillum sp.]|uniref:RNA-binding S4 domain-containing protein n=1 Tax=Candidatus Puniceispirillum sp. TaxID=2026719 RepID=UPI001ECF30A5|nr:RNA-binding S4 domain-containing protein [Candidatus Puniceispirillum sp.]MBT6415983.1 RNA-binding S4 domain-containing protein [Candidatus Puniceispirillum sp.]MBT6567139.1 RNA-binding S4 domain-containing protein [Candidatus Puniceispirillum sp.]